jgi:hypothetical protein
VNVRRANLEYSSDILDDLVLSCQRAIDRAIRRFRRGAPPAVAKRRFLVIQIDGLSRAVFERAIASGHMRFVNRLLQRGGHCVQPMSVSLPTSTPAFQMAAFYGVRPDIPGFHYYSRERKADIHFPRSGTRSLGRVATRREPARHPCGWQRLRLLLHRRCGQQLFHLHKPYQAQRVGRIERAVAIRRRRLGGSQEPVAELRRDLDRRCRVRPSATSARAAVGDGSR